MGTSVAIFLAVILTLAVLAVLTGIVQGFLQVGAEKKAVNLADEYLKKWDHARIDARMAEEELAAARQQKDREMTTTINFSWGYYNGSP